MVFRKGGRQTSTNLRSHGGPGLVMECWEEALSPSQVAAFKQKVLECQRAQEKVKEAHHLAAIGMAVVTVLDDPRKAIPPSTLKQQRPDLNQAGKAPPSEPQDSQRSTSPDIIFIGESPPIPKTPPTPNLASPSPNLASPPQPRSMPTSSIQAIPRQLIHRFPSYQMQSTPTSLQIQGGSIRFVAPVGAQVTPVQGTYGIGVKRALPPQPLADISPKRKKMETDNEGNWVPLDEFYYGKSEGDPSYSEEKSEFRFKCWYCNKMLYNNIKAMMHIQGHIDSSKQQNIDLSDLTQCKHCYRQFDTPFEMQTHVEKVHMSNVNVLMCRICERDHQSRQALMTHMRVNHNACEMPYICQLCKFRSSMYSDVVDHFKKKHDSSQHILCLYCLKVFSVKFVSQGWGQTQTYYGHLLKHQSKSSSKKCTYCRLTFVNPGDCKNHKKKDHAANQKGIDSCHSAFGQDMMIKVPESGLVRKQSLKSLNAPAVSKVLDFGGTRFPYAVNFNTCVECKTVMGTPDHFRKHIECSMCRFATSCSIAYANHMMGFHSGQMTSLNLNIPWERPMKDTMHCLCGFASRYGNKIANHLVYCTKRSCYSTKPAQVERPVEEQEEQDPRHKPGASLLDVLGLVKKKNIATKDFGSTDTEILRRRSSEETSEVLWKSSETPTAPPTGEDNQEEDRIPQELKGAEKWKTVKIKDPSTPTKASVFLGAAEETFKEVETAKTPQVLSAVTEKIIIKKKEEIKEEIDQSSLVDDSVKQEEEMKGSKEEKGGENKDEEDDKIKLEGGGSEDTDSECRKKSIKEDEDSSLNDQNDNVEEDVKKESCSEDDKVEKEEISADIMDSSVGDNEEDINAEGKESEEGRLESETVEDSFLMEDQGTDGNLDEGDDSQEVVGKKQRKFQNEEEERKEDREHFEELIEEESNVGDQVEDIKEGDEENLKTAECPNEDLKENTEGETMEEEIEDGEKKSVEEDEASSEKEKMEMDTGTEETEKRLEDESRSEEKVEDQPFEEETMKDKPGKGEPMEDQHSEGEKTDEGKMEGPKNEEEKQQETEEGIRESLSGNQGTGSDTLVDDGAKSLTQSEDTDKTEKEDPTTKQTEEGQRSKDTNSPSHSEKRSGHSHHHHHHDNHTGDRRDQSASDRHRPRSDPHDNRDSYRHHDSSRNTENRHQYDRHLYDNRRHVHHDNRHGHHDNRHGHHDSRHGYHGNRHSRHGYHDNRGHWGGQGNYRGGFRDNYR